MRFVRALLALITIVAAASSILVLMTSSPGTELGTVWHSGAPESLNLTQAVVQRYLHPVVWSHVLLPVLLFPAVVVFTVITVLALFPWLWLRRRRQTKSR